MELKGVLLSLLFVSFVPFVVKFFL